MHYLVVFALVCLAAFRIRNALSLEHRILLIGLPVLGLLSMPVSWLLLEKYKWALIPQVQPLRTLLFVMLAMQIFTAAAGAHAAKRGLIWEALAWFTLAFLPPLVTVFTQPIALPRAAVALGLAALATVAAWRIPRFAPVVALAAFFAIPRLGGVVNYPHLETPELRQLSEWARSATPRDAVFLFPDAGHSLDSGVFRSVALRAVYVDWKSGGQVNYLKGFAEEWWFRWQETIAAGFDPADLPKYDGLGIAYVVLSPRNRLPRAPAFENDRYVAYAVR